MNKPLLSMIIVTLNEESVIAETIKALETLSVPHEIIVSDGKSTDRTAELARPLATKVLVYEGTARQTIAMGRNDGAAAASGDFLVFLDADSRILHPNEFFAEALQCFERDSKLVALTARLRVFPDMETFGDWLVFGCMHFIIKFQNNVLHRGESTGEFQMIRRTAFEQVHGFNGSLVTREDGDMFYRLSKIGHTRLDSRLTVFHTGRRAHKIGWIKLLWTWGINSVWFAIFGTAKSKEWTVIR